MNRNGSPHCHQLKVTCRDCNNGWIKDIHDGAIPYLTPLIQGICEPITEEAMMKIAVYAVLVTMVSEFSDSDTIATAQQARSNFSKNQILPSDWQVYLGRCNQEVYAGSNWHRGYAINNIEINQQPKKLSNENLNEIKLKFNAQTTTFYLGNCFIHTLSGPDLNFLPNSTEYASHLGIRRCWPNPENLSTSTIFFFKSRRYKSSFMHFTQIKFANTNS